MIYFPQQGRLRLSLLPPERVRPAPGPALPLPGPSQGGGGEGLCRPLSGGGVPDTEGLVDKGWVDNVRFYKYFCKKREKWQIVGRDFLDKKAQSSS